MLKFYENWKDAEKEWGGGNWAWPNFTIKEIAQRGEGWREGLSPVVISTDFLDKLQMMRNLCEFSFNISSWYRSPEYNAQVSSTGLSGPHTTGEAVDIRCYGEVAQKLVYYAVKCEFPGIGIQQKGDFSKRFIHLDTARTSKAFWSY